MDAKKYTVYLPEEPRVSCRVYIRCNCGPRCCKHKYDDIPLLPEPQRDEH